MTDPEPEETDAPPPVVEPHLLSFARALEVVLAEKHPGVEFRFWPRELEPPQKPADE